MQLDYRVSLKDYLQGKITVRLQVVAEAGLHTFGLQALDTTCDVQVLDLRVLDATGEALPFIADQSSIRVQGTGFQISYTLRTGYRFCVGVDKQADLICPFTNESEIFFGSGALTHPDPLPELAGTLQVTFAVEDVPDGWTVFGSMDEPHPAKLDAFFVYVVADVQPYVYQHPAMEGLITLRFMAGRGVDLPRTLDELALFAGRFLTWAEAHIAPFSQQHEINTLILRAPDDFEQITDGKTMASGENILNGIVVYGPRSTEYLQKHFGYDDYTYFLYDGLAHELMHAYTTTAWQGKYKSVLYPAPECRPNDKWLLGESLNGYFHDQWVREQFGRSFVKERLSRSLSTYHIKPVKSDIINLFLLDRFLQANGNSLLQLFSAVVRQRQLTQQPYKSAAFLFDVLSDAFGIDAPYFKDLFLKDMVPDYPKLLSVALKPLGYRVTRHPGGEYYIEEI